MYRKGNETPSLQPLSALRRSRMRFGTRVLNWLFDNTEAARTGSVGVKHAEMVRAVGTSVLKMATMKPAQISHPAVITGPSKISKARHFFAK